MHVTKILTVTLIVITLNISTQEFDEDYLASLPDTVRDDILNKAKERENAEKPVFRSESSEVDIKEGNKLKVFGSDFFNTFQSTFMPINEPNFDAEYILDYGDVLRIQLIGQKDLDSTLKISRDGSISLPDIGKVNLSGLNLQAASNIIQLKTKEFYIGTEAYISLESVRDINVMIAGNVFKPGIYTLSGNSNALHALVMAGGINDYGSYRDIKVKRNGETIQTLDIYDYLIFGNSYFHKRLQSGDFIFVEKAQNIVSIDGAVKRPMLYELKLNENLGQALYFANGLRPDADVSKIFVDSLSEGKIQRTKILNIEDLNNIKSKDRDTINIGDFRLRRVILKGAVKNPGTYLINEGDGIASLIKRAGGYSENAYPLGGILINQSAKVINESANAKIYDDLISTIFDMVSTHQSGINLDALIQLAENIKNTNVSGRVNAEFNLEKLRENPELDTDLHNNDEIIIPELVNHIYVYGEVTNTGTITFDQGKDIESYISELGGLLDSADSKNIFVVLPNGKSMKLEQRNKIFMSDKNNKFELSAGSIIFVPRIIDDSSLRRQTLQAYVSILGNIGVSLASLSVLKD